MMKSNLPLFTVFTSPAERLFPKLTPEHIDRIAAHGRSRNVREGEILSDVGVRNAPFFIIKTGSLEIVSLSRTGESVMGSIGPGQFTGEISMLSGRPRFVRVRVSESGELIELTREQMEMVVRCL